MSNFRRMALFIDAPNLYMTANAMGFDIDFRRLLKEFQSRATIVRALYYSQIFERRSPLLGAAVARRRTLEHRSCPRKFGEPLFRRVSIKRRGHYRTGV